MKRKGLLLGLVILFVASAFVFGQVCVVSNVIVSGYGTTVVTFTNNGTTSEFVKVEVKWDNNQYSRIFGRTIPAGTTTGSGKNAKFVPGTHTENVAGIISSINECP